MASGWEINKANGLQTAGGSGSAARMREEEKKLRAGDSIRESYQTVIMLASISCCYVLFSFQ
jgi:hypothetical protein